MAGLIKSPTQLACWQSMIGAAQADAKVNLIEAQESYLVFMLMRFMNDPDLIQSVIALDYLKAMQSTGSWRRQQLKSVADKCLLVCGLFPGWASRRRLNVAYFVSLGQAAFAELSDTEQEYLGLAHGFVMMAQVLQALRPTTNLIEILEPLAAVELFSATSSTMSQHAITHYTDGFLIINRDNKLAPNQH